MKSYEELIEENNRLTAAIELAKKYGVWESNIKEMPANSHEAKI